MPKKKLKHNPKLDQSDDKKKKGLYQREVDQYEEERNYSKYYMILVFVGALAVISILIFVVFTQGGTRIEQYDLVRLDYRIYTSEDYYDHKDPTIEEMNTWVNVCSRYDSECDSGLIKGFYDALLGKRAGDLVNAKPIDKCIDLNKDGKDDYSGKEALSYGYPKNHSLYNTDIVLYFKIHEVNKSSSTEIQAHTSSGYQKVKNDGYHNLINYILVFKREEREFLF